MDSNLSDQPTRVVERADDAADTVSGNWEQLTSENQSLRLQVEGVAEANANAAELLAELERTKTELQDREAYLRTLIDSLPVGILVVDTRTRCILDANPYALQLTERAKGDLIGSRCNTIICQTGEFLCPILDLGQKVDHSERILLGVDGQQVPVLKSVVPIMRDGCQVLLESFVDISSIKNAEEKVRKANCELAEAHKRLIAAKEEAETAAVQDPLTKLPNRRLFNSRLNLCLQRSQRHREFLCAVLYLDLDRFKVINDSLGHQVGDELLVEAANRLQSTLRRTDVISRFPGGEDLVARLGGDEFAILLDDIKDTSDALRVAERISENFSVPFHLRGRDLSITASVGITTSASQYPTAESMLRDADTAMYRAKATGRGKYVVFDTAMHTRAVERLHLESALRQAVDKKQFILQYQPILSLMNEHVIGFEALVRWQSPARGLVPPAMFISVAEETGLIVPIGAWVLHEACTQLRRWHDRFGCEPLLTMNVNLSARQFSQPDLVDTVAEVLNSTGLQGRSLLLELTESAAMEDPQRTSSVIAELRHLGVRLCIDDFGTGYSSLDHLDRFSVDTLKIDRHFVARMQDERNQNIVKTIISLAHNLRMNVVAEGVETAEHVGLLSSMNCDCVQGFFFSEPVDAAKLELLLEKQRDT
jgi:diguanylate cyclase (GGDEF)-like protein/PAS domain S-box-containing protein